MRKLILALCALCLLLPSARAAVIVPTQNTGARIEAAKSAASQRELGAYGMIPIPGAQVPDGEYPVKVESTSPFFRIVAATLYVEGGVMSADITIGSLSYDLVRVDEDIPGIQADGRTVFRIPVPALNAPFDCAAHSVARDRWYDRRLLVDASSLPEGTLPFELPDYALLEKALMAYGDAPAESAPASAGAEPVAVDLPDGEYSIEVSLSGGSGRAAVSSPTVLLVRDGRGWARLLWSSAYYDYMLVDGARYENMADGGSSTFEIPIAALDAPMTVVADTTAMGDPVEIEYQLTFYAETIGDKSQVPQEAAKQVLLISLAIIVAGGVLNHFVKKGRR